VVLSVSVVKRVAIIRNYQAFSDLSLLFPLYRVVKYMFLFIIYFNDLYICLVSNYTICLDLLIYYKAKGRSNLLSFSNQDLLTMCCLKFTCTTYKSVRSYHTEQVLRSF